MLTTLRLEPAAQYCTAPTNPWRELCRQPCLPLRSFGAAEAEVASTLMRCLRFSCVLCSTS